MGNNEIMAEIVQPRVYGVAEINVYLHEYLAEDEFLSLIAVRGEVSGFRAHSAGHVYFTLKEQDSSLKVVMFRRFAEQMRDSVQDGDEIVVIGGISLYQRDGSCQLYAEEVFLAGDGKQARALSELKEKLAGEGLFAVENKKTLPPFVFNIGVITSAQGAAWADIERIAYSRNPYLRLRLYPALVQGEQAPASLLVALQAADCAKHDLLIIGRGGGAEADLAAFDHELVVRAIAAAKTPIITAIGHESDFSLSDLAADVRAATPTHAATIAVTDIRGVEEMLAEISLALKSSMSDYLDSRYQRLAGYDLPRAAAMALAKQQQQLLLAITRLEMINPLATLARGYAIIETADGLIVREAARLKQGDLLKIYPSKGKILAKVEEIENG